MATIRVHKRSKFAQIPNETLQDPTIRNAARGLLVTMLSYPDDWEFNMTHLRKATGETEHALRAQMQTLLEAGYVKRWRVQRGWEYKVYESLVLAESSPPDSTPADSTDEDLRTYIKTEDSTKTEKEIKKGKSLPKSDQVEAALRDPSSSEARAFLADSGMPVDDRPKWDMRKLLKRTLGEAFNHPQVQENLESWAGRITALEIRNAHMQAVARYQREPRSSKLRPVHFFVDILNGTYKPDAHEVAELEAEQAAAKAAAVAAAPKSGDRVQLPDGTISIVHEYLSAGNWVVLTDRVETFRPQEVKVIV